MIRMEQEEFFIEPVEKGEEVIAEGEKEGGGGRTHIVYRSSAVKKAAVSGAAADFHSRGQCAAPAVAAPSTGGRHLQKSLHSFVTVLLDRK